MENENQSKLAELDHKIRLAEIEKDKAQIEKYKAEMEIQKQIKLAEIQERIRLAEIHQNHPIDEHSPGTETEKTEMKGSLKTGDFCFLFFVLYELLLLLLSPLFGLESLNVDIKYPLCVHLCYAPVCFFLFRFVLMFPFRGQYCFCLRCDDALV
jgi:hypothetical protein